MLRCCSRHGDQLADFGLVPPVYAIDCAEGDGLVPSTALIDDSFAKDRVLVVFSNEVSLQFNEYDASDFSEIGCSSVTDMTDAVGEKVRAKIGNNEIAILNGTGYQSTDTIDIADYNQVICLELTDGGKQNVLDAIKILQARDDVIYAGPDYVISLSTTVPNDAEFDLQNAADIIQLQEAWDITTGSSSIIVGVIDSGIDSTHTDLDGNVNREMSRDFTSGTTMTESIPTDNHYHGTHVAGIIGAEGNNGNGIAGVCWDVELVSLKVFDEEGYGYSSHVVMAINYAENAGIPILNFSGGYDANHEYYDQALSAAIQNYSGLFVCAAGNSGSNNDLVPFYPSNHNSLDNVISVGNSTSTDTIASDSNFGSNTVDLFAPGEYIRSTYPGNGYINISGTSMAAPFVSGAAALIMSKNPQMLPCEIKDTIMSNVDDCGTTFDNRCVSDGRLNVYNALANIVTHSASYTNLGNTIGHRRTCTSCGCSAVRPHKYTNISRNNSLTHIVSCDCGNAIYEAHTWNAGKVKCLVCGYNSSGLGTID